MSLKSYLFLLVALLIVSLTLVQLAFVSYIKAQLNDEIQGKSQTLSEQIINFVVDDLPMQQFTIEQPKAPVTAATPEQIAQHYIIEVSSEPQQVIEINDQYSLVLGEKAKIIELTPRSPQGSGQKQSQQELQPQLKQLLANIKVTHDNNFDSFTLLKHKENSIEQKLFEFNEQDSVSDRYFGYLIGVICAMSLPGLLIAYWLAHHISKPLAQLSDGFTALEQGQLGTALETTGIKEVRNTLESFNHMSARLQSLSKQEQQFIKHQHIAELGEVTRGLAHALRNPINTVGLSIEQMAQDNLPPERRQQLASIARSKITAMDNTIKSLLTLATNTDLTPEPVNINNVLLDIILELSMSEGDAPSINITSTTAVVINGIESEIRAIIHTVLVNAVEASTNQESVIVEFDYQMPQLIITISDSGSGIDQSISDKLFQPHVTTKPEGAGMGLYIAKRLCQLHYQGDITLSNRPEGGCVATISLCSKKQP